MIAAEIILDKRYKTKMALYVTQIIGRIGFHAGSY